MRKGLSATEIEKEMQNRRSFIDFLQGVLNLNPVARWSPEQARKHPFITGEAFLAPYIPNSQSTSLSKSLATLQNGEVREIRSVRSRSSSNSISSPKAPARMQFQPSSVESNNSGYLGLSMSDDRGDPHLTADSSSGGQPSSEVGRIAGNFADFRIQTHGIPSSNTQPNSASVLQSSNPDLTSQSSHRRRLSISIKPKYQGIPVRKDQQGQYWDYSAYAGSYGSQQSIPDYFAEHPRYGDFGERQRIPSRLPSAAASVDWEPFQDHEGYYGRSSRQSSASDMNWTADPSGKIPGSPRSQRYQSGYLGDNLRGSRHNRSSSISSINSTYNNENSRMDVVDQTGRRQSVYGSHGEIYQQGQMEQGQRMSHGSHSHSNSMDYTMGQPTDIPGHNMGHLSSSFGQYPSALASSPSSRGTFPISPRSSQSNLFPSSAQGYFKQPQKRINSIHSIKGFEGSNDDIDQSGMQRRSVGHGPLSITTQMPHQGSLRLGQYGSPRHSQQDMNTFQLPPSGMQGLPMHPGQNPYPLGSPLQQSNPSLIPHDKSPTSNQKKYEFHQEDPSQS
jgi:hypothetical protein